MHHCWCSQGFSAFFYGAAQDFVRNAIDDLEENQLIGEQLYRPAGAIV